MKKKILRPVLQQALRPFQEFAEKEASGGLLLLFCALVALVWANSSWAESYLHFWHLELTVGAGSFVFSRPLHFWINDGLMTIFFFVVGLEIKREMLVGELASPKKAALPIIAALGGMLAPAAIYAALNSGTPGAPGWGIPMATDIAFAVGVLAVLGDRVPLPLKVFLVALAIVDDIGAVLVIAFFYTAEISWSFLAYAASLLGVLAAANLSEVRCSLVYALLGIALWLAFLGSGVHATLAGILLALMIPARSRINTEEFLGRGRNLLDDFEEAGPQGEGILDNEERQAAVGALKQAVRQVEAPMQRLEHKLHPWVSFGVMPLFALANAGVTLSGDIGSMLVQPVSLGVILGLVLGKQVGITLFSWMAVRTGLAAPPDGVKWLQIYGAGWLGGIGFTMSLFIANLAFDKTPLLPIAKIGILTASVIAGGFGWIILRKKSL